METLMKVILIWLALSVIIVCFLRKLFHHTHEGMIDPDEMKKWPFSRFSLCPLPKSIQPSELGIVYEVTNPDKRSPITSGILIFSVIQERALERTKAEEIIIGARSEKVVFYGYKLKNGETFSFLYNENKNHYGSFFPANLYA